MSVACQTRWQEAKRRHLCEQHDIILHEVIEMEVRMGISNRWEPTMPKYQQTMKYMKTCEYHRALDNLQRLVVQRLFELHKLNLLQTGEYLMLLPPRS